MYTKQATARVNKKMGIGGGGKGSNAKKEQKHQNYEFPKTLNTYLGQKGYTIPKSELSKEECEMLEKKLIVVPKTNTPSFAGTPDNSFPAYRESAKKYYVPRFFGIKYFGEPKEYTLWEGENIDVPFVKSLRENQIPVVKAYMERVKDKKHGGGLLELPCAYGKCLARNTGIIMFDGTIKMVQDITSGEKIMGDDSTPRTILSVCQGREKMVRIYNVKHGVDYVVNMSHILSLKNIMGKTVDICVGDYIKLSEHERHRLFGYRVGVEFSYKEIPMNAYNYGYELGIKIDVYEFANNKVIPKRIMPCYLYNDRSNRLKLLAGLIDSTGIVEDNKIYILCSTIEFSKDVLFLCRSLGFFCSWYKNRYQCIMLCDARGAHGEGGQENTFPYLCKMKNIPTRNETCNMVHDDGTICSSLNHRSRNIDILDCAQDDIASISTIASAASVVSSSVASVATTPSIEPTISKKDKYSLMYTIHFEVLEEDDYFGFEIDGNRRFLLDDFTVTHNTVLSLSIISELKKKTLVIVNKEFLMNQWIERIAEFLPSARVGRIQGQIIDIENKDIVLGMLQSISMKDYDTEVFSSFGLTIIDEVHHISSEVFSRALFKIVSKYMLGLSATMERKDGTTTVFKMFLGDVAFKGEHTEKHNVSVRGIEYITNDHVFNEVECDFRGQPKYSTMITKLCSFGPRSDFIVGVVKDLLEEEPDSQIMILAHNRNLLEYLYDMIEYKKIATVGYYLGGMKEKDLKITETRQVVIATYAMAAEALDIKTLSCLVMATPKTDIVQSVGRILRMKHRNPRVVDIIDKHDLFQRQWGQRKKFYKKCNYRIRTIQSFHYEGMKLNWETDNTWKKVFEPSNFQNAAKNHKNGEVDGYASSSNESDHLFIEDDEENTTGKKCMIDISTLE
jgi:superfamily II DNA or RNA helicase